VHITSARDGSGRLFVVQQSGQIVIIQSNSVLPQPFLNITNRVNFVPGSLDGLLSMAFPTNYSAKGYFYVYYSRTNDAATVISRFYVSTNANQADPSSEQVIMTIPIVGNPNRGGQVAFGRDGYLYISTGDDLDIDGMSLATETNSLWGKILRVDVEGTTNSYKVPADNPFVGQPSAAGEVWALGLRNPWRFSFDRVSGDLYIGDVGQGNWEEVDLQPAASHGGENYGWDYLEGNHFYEGIPPGFDTNSLVPPIIEYAHFGIGNAVTGGFVYRGPASPRMNGLYIFGDFNAGKTWAAAQSGTNWTFQDTTLPSPFLSTFGEDESGQLYLANYFAGKIYKLSDSGLAQPPVFVPPGGVVPTDTIAVSCASPGAIVHYTTNGLAPTVTDPAVGSNGLVLITGGITLSARSFRADLQPSTITTAAYNLQVGTPVFSPGHGPVTNGTFLSITTTTPAAAIYFTLDGTDPTPSSMHYAAPVPINATNIVSARAYKTGFNDSLIQRVYFNGAVALQLAAVMNGMLVFHCSSDSGRNYQMQSSSGLVSWADDGSPVAGTGGTLSFLITPDHQQQFLRLRIY
jgi:hypothetical protein